MQTDKVLLSIIIPVYNVEKYLTFCVDSIFKQGLNSSHFEVLLIDDGSKDNSYQVCLDLKKKYSNIRLFRQENLGQSVARNKGLEEAKGIYINFIDSDDYLLNNGLGQVLALAIKRDYDFVGYGIERVKYRKLNESEKIEELYNGNGLYLLAQHNYNNSACWYIYRKEKFPNVYFIPNRWCEDGLFTSQILSIVQNGVILGNRIYCYVENQTSTLNTTDNQKLVKLRDDMYFISKSFNDVLQKLVKNDKNYDKAYNRLKDRQESYLFFALIRSIKTNERARDVIDKINSSGNEYPMKNFDGYQNNLNKFLIEIFNKPKLLFLALKINNIVNIFKDLQKN